MARPTKRKVPGGSGGDRSSKRVTPPASRRYTPPVPQSVKVSPRWVPVVMFVLLGLGLMVIILNYVELLPGATTNWYLVIGLGFILGPVVCELARRVDPFPTPEHWQTGLALNPFSAPALISAVLATLGIWMGLDLLLTHERTGVLIFASALMFGLTVGVVCLTWATRIPPKQPPAA